MLLWVSCITAHAKVKRVSAPRGRRRDRGKRGFPSHANDGGVFIFSRFAERVNKLCCRLQCNIDLQWPMTVLALNPEEGGGFDDRIEFAQHL